MYRNVVGRNGKPDGECSTETVYVYGRGTNNYKLQPTPRENIAEETECKRQVSRGK